jgi:phage FluMu protein Com
MKVKCHKCGNIMGVTSLERPLKIKCPICGTVGVLKAKAPEKQYVPPVSSTPDSPYASYPSHAPYPAQHPSYTPYPSPPAWCPEKKKTNTVLAAGVLLIIAGLLAIGNAIADIFLISTENIPSVPGYEGIANLLIVCFTIILVFAIIAILGGVMAVTRKSWVVALIGGILGLFTLGPLFISSILSLIALILIAVSKEEFR